MLYTNKDHAAYATYLATSKMIDDLQTTVKQDASKADKILKGWTTLEHAREILQAQYHGEDPTTLYCGDCLSSGCDHAWQRSRWYRELLLRFQSERQRLFIGVFPCGLGYADKSIEVSGDYKEVAFLPYSTLVLEIRDAKSPLLDEVRQHAEKIIARRGQQYQVSTCGQTVLLGSSA
jgi:hypothetical protein